MILSINSCSAESFKEAIMITDVLFSLVRVYYYAVFILRVITNTIVMLSAVNLTVVILNVTVPSVMAPLWFLRVNDHPARSHSAHAAHCPKGTKRAFYKDRHTDKVGR